VPLPVKGEAGTRSAEKGAELRQRATSIARLIEWIELRSQVRSSGGGHSARLHGDLLQHGCDHARSVVRRRGWLWPAEYGV